MTAKASKGVFTDPQIIHEFDDGSKIAYINNEQDLKTFGTLMGHCAGSQRVWALEEKIWYFFTILDPQGTPHGTIHMKQASWMAKAHPRDGEEGTGPLRRCSAYDHSVGRTHEPQRNLENQFGIRLPNKASRPQGMDEGIWSALVKAYKAADDNYKKNVGSVQIVGRRVKFDGKNVIVLSANGRYGSSLDDYRSKIGEWLNSMNRKKVAA